MFGVQHALMSKVATTSEPEPKPGKLVDSLKIQYHNNPSITPVINATIVMLQYIYHSKKKWITLT